MCGFCSNKKSNCTNLTRWILKDKHTHSHTHTTILHRKLTHTRKLTQTLMHFLLNSQSIGSRWLRDQVSSSQFLCRIVQNVSDSLFILPRNSDSKTENVLRHEAYCRKVFAALPPVFQKDSIFISPFGCPSLYPVRSNVRAAVLSIRPVVCPSVRSVLHLNDHLV